MSKYYLYILDFDSEFMDSIERSNKFTIEGDSFYSYRKSDYNSYKEREGKKLPVGPRNLDLSQNLNRNFYVNPSGDDADFWVYPEGPVGYYIMEGHISLKYKENYQYFFPKL